MEYECRRQNTSRSATDTSFPGPKHPLFAVAPNLKSYWETGISYWAATMVRSQRQYVGLIYPNPPTPA
jgi:hypothetical protein